MANDNGKIKETLLEFVRSKTQSEDKAAITEQTLIIDGGLITSVDVLELIFLIESLGNIEIDATELEPDMLRSVDKIYRTFLE